MNVIRCLTCGSPMNEAHSLTCPFRKPAMPFAVTFATPPRHGKTAAQLATAIANGQVTANQIRSGLGFPPTPPPARRFGQTAVTPAERKQLMRGWSPPWRTRLLEQAIATAVDRIRQLEAQLEEKP